MTNEETYKQLVAMKIYGMAEVFHQYLNQKESDDLTFEERFGIMVDTEWSERQTRRLQYRLNNAKLREKGSVEDINYRHPRNLDRSVMQKLCNGNWIKNNENIILTGPTGVGKTWLACALANKACRDGYHAFYTRIPRLLHDLYVGHGDGTYPKKMDKLAKFDVLILDDFGLSQLSDTERRDLLEVVEDRQGRSATIFTSQLRVKHWHETIGEPTIADAILDRAISNSHRIELNGSSLR